MLVSSAGIILLC